MPNFMLVSPNARFFTNLPSYRHFRGGKERFTDRGHLSGTELGCFSYGAHSATLFNIHQEDRTTN